MYFLWFQWGYFQPAMWSFTRGYPPPIPLDKLVVQPSEPLMFWPSIPSEPLMFGRAPGMGSSVDWRKVSSRLVFLCSDDSGVHREVLNGWKFGEKVGLGFSRCKWCFLNEILGVSQIYIYIYVCVYFYPKNWGNDAQFDYIICFKWVGSTTN